MKGPIERIGSATIGRVRRLLYALGFMVDVFKQTFRFVTHRTVGSRVLTMQVLFTGVEALSVVATISLSLGAVIVIQGLSLLPQFGQALRPFAIRVLQTLQSIPFSLE